MIWTTLSTVTSRSARGLAYIESLQQTLVRPLDYGVSLSIKCLSAVCLKALEAYVHLIKLQHTIVPMPLAGCQNDGKAIL